jgi:hypothetical protein
MTATRDQLCQLSGVLNRGSEQSNLFSPLVLGTGHIAIGYPNDLPPPKTGGRFRMYQKMPDHR